MSGEETLWNLMRGALTARALAIVAELRIADALADGPQRIDEDVTYRLLRALASDGVFEEVEPGVFRNTEASELLRGGGGWDDFAHLFGGIWFRSIAELDAQGKPTFPQVFGADFWSWLAAHPDERASFDRAMEQGKERRLARLAGVDWRGDELVVDVGGGNGSFLRALLAQYEGLRGVVFDLPETVRDESTFIERLTFVEGSFFDSVPPGDVYLLGTILHDWDDERALKILRTIRASAADDARLILLEGVVAPGNEPDGAKWLDLLMLTLFDGRERDEAQWRTLLDEGGWRVEFIAPGVIEARCR
ncbi:MAG: methyltransferase [Gaiellaceae bacterium]